MPPAVLFVIGLLLFQLLIILHEYGHFLVAKRHGVTVKEFGLGLPPRLIGKTMGRGIFRCYYSLNWLPIGGFVRLKGESDSATGDGTYGSCSLYTKAKIILAGVAVNFIIAVFLFSILALVGIPRFLPAEPLTSEQQFTIANDTKIIDSRVIVTFVDEGSPAESMGLQPGDQVLTVNNQEITSHADLRTTTTELAGQEVVLTILRNRQTTYHQASLRTADEVNSSATERQRCLSQTDDDVSCPRAQGHLGVYTTDLVLQRSTWSAPITGLALGIQYTKVTLQGLWQAVSSLATGDAGTAGQNTAGPLGILFILQASATYGAPYLLMIVALISLTLAIMNTLPIPALDGGRLALTVLFRKVLKKPLKRRLEERIVGTSMVALLILIAVITVADIKRFL